VTRVFPVIVLALAGLLSIVIGVRGLLAPEELGVALGYALPGADALNEVRAQYGGLFLTVGTICELAIFRVVPRQAALMLLATVFGGILFGRIFSLLADGGFAVYGRTIQLLYAVDLIGLVAALAALVAERALATRTEKS
jgi:hypothetical protein